MATKKIHRLTDRSNIAIINAIRNDLGSEYAHRITPATQAGLRETANDIIDHRPTRNAFADALINRIGSVLIRNMLWTNPLAEFKRGQLEFGETIEEIYVGMVTARQYDPDRNKLEKEIFGRHEPHVEANYHKVNRRDYYPITVAETDLRDAFISSEGLYDLTSRILQAPTTSDAYDEFLLMCSLFEQYEQNGGYYHINVPDLRNISAGGDEARDVLKKVRAMAETLTFPSLKYNAAKVYSQVNRDDLVLFGTPEAFATIDVDALAGAFNIDRATMAGRQITIPEDKFGLTGAQMILTSKDFFVMADRILETTSAENPVGLSRNYFLHHHQVISNSRFVPAVLFHTGHDDSEPIVVRSVDGISNITVSQRDPATGEWSDNANTTAVTVDRGERLIVSAHGTHTGDGDPTNPDVWWTLQGNNDPRTRVTRQGTVHIGGREDATSVKIIATTVWINPDNAMDTETQTRERTLTINPNSPLSPVWPATDWHQTEEEEEEEEGEDI